MGKGNAPDRGRARPDPSVTGVEADESYPVLCLRFVQSRFGFEELTEKQRSEFIRKWAKRAQLSWTELVQHSRKGLGFENIPAHEIKRQAPESLAAGRYLVMRHEGNHAVVGVRAGGAYRVLWIEANYGDVYDHG